MTARKKGSIILFSSIRSQVVEPGQSVYAATKAGIVQLARTAAAEFGPHGVRVNAIAPGVIETPLTAPIKANQAWYDAYAAKSVLGRWGRADEIVGAGGIPGVGRVELRDRHGPVRRRRLAGGRRPVHASRHVRYDLTGDREIRSAGGTWLVRSSTVTSQPPDLLDLLWRDRDECHE